MLTADDLPTIRFAIVRRLDLEPGVKICDLKMVPRPGCIAVGVLAMINETAHVISRFELPDPFELSHLHDEIDEIAEHVKTARKNAGAGLLELPERTIPGTGLRGRWLRYG